MEKELKKFQDTINNYLPQYKDQIFKAFTMAEKYHRDQYRKNGELYITHPLAVATILAEIKADADTICAGLLHDTLEDTVLTKEEITREFNSDVTKLVEGMTKIRNTSFSSKKDANYANIRKLVASMTDDIRIIIIKLADRLHNMRTLQYKDYDDQQKIALETKNIFVPLAEKIGAFQMKCELEDLSFMYLEPEAYNEIANDLIGAKDTIIHNLEVMSSKISELLNGKNVPHQIKIRVKNIYEIYMKRINQQISLDSIPNVYSLHIIVKDYISCYETLGWIHSVYTPIDSMTRYYISNPKYSLHRAIHTTVFGPQDRLVQAQIKTEEMDVLSNYGLTAFWQMSTDDVREKMQQALREKFDNYESLSTIQAMNIGDSEFVERIKQEVLSPGIIVYTPMGEPIKLPKGSTVIDFAYRIHTKLGDHLVSARVNGKNESIYYQLEQDDRIRVINDPETISCEPSWLEHAKTIRAQKCIESALKKKELNLVLRLSE